MQSSWAPDSWSLPPSANNLLACAPLDERGYIRPEFQQAAWEALTTTAGWGTMPVPTSDSPLPSVASPWKEPPTRPDVVYRGHSTPSAWASPKGAFVRGTFTAPSAQYAAAYATNQNGAGCLLPPTVGFLSSWRLKDLTAPASTNWADRDGALPYAAWLATEKAPGQRFGDSMFEVLVGPEQVTRQKLLLLVGRTGECFKPTGQMVLPETPEMDDLLGALQYAAYRIRTAQALMQNDATLTGPAAWNRSATESAPAESLAAATWDLAGKTMSASHRATATAQIAAEQATMLNPSTPSLVEHDASLAGLRGPKAVETAGPLGYYATFLAREDRAEGFGSPPGLGDSSLWADLLRRVRDGGSSPNAWAVFAWGAARAGVYPATAEGWEQLLATAPNGTDRTSASAAFWGDLRTDSVGGMMLSHHRWSHQAVLGFISVSLSEGTMPPEVMLSVALLAPDAATAALLVDQALIDPYAGSANRDQILNLCGLFPALLQDPVRAERLLNQPVFQDKETYQPFQMLTMSPLAMVGLAACRHTSRGVASDMITADLHEALEIFDGSRQAPRPASREGRFVEQDDGAIRFVHDTPADPTTLSEENRTILQAAQWIQSTRNTEMSDKSEATVVAREPLSSQVRDGLAQGYPNMYRSLPYEALAESLAFPSQQPELRATTTTDPYDTLVALSRAITGDAGARLTTVLGGLSLVSGSGRNASDLDELRQALNAPVFTDAQRERLAALVAEVGGITAYSGALLRCHHPTVEPADVSGWTQWIAGVVTGPQRTVAPEAQETQKTQDISHHGSDRDISQLADTSFVEASDAQVVQSSAVAKTPAAEKFSGEALDADDLSSDRPTKMVSPLSGVSSLVADLRIASGLEARVAHLIDGKEETPAVAPSFPRQRATRVTASPARSSAGLRP